MPDSEMAPRVAMTNIGAVDASGTPKHNVFVAPCTCRLLGAALVCGDTLALHSANYGDYNITNVTETQEVASLSTHTGEADANAIAADTEEEFTLNGTAANLELDDGDVLEFNASESGTATSGDLTECAIKIEWAPGTGAGA